MTVQPSSSRSPSESGCGDAGLELGPLGGLGAGDVRAVERARGRPATPRGRPRERSVRRRQHVLGVGDRHRAGGAGGDQLVVVGPAAEHEVLVDGDDHAVVEPEDRRGRLESGRQNAVCSPDSARPARAADRGAGAEPGVGAGGVGRDAASGPVAGGAADACARAASCSTAPEPGTVPSTRSKATPGGMGGAAWPGRRSSVWPSWNPEARVQPSTDEPLTGTPSTAGWPLPDQSATPEPVPPSVSARTSAKDAPAVAEASPPGRPRRRAPGRHPGPDTEAGVEGCDEGGRAGRVDPQQTTAATGDDGVSGEDFTAVGHGAQPSDRATRREAEYGTPRRAIMTTPGAGGTPGDRSDSRGHDRPCRATGERRHAVVTTPSSAGDRRGAPSRAARAPCSRTRRCAPAAA